MIKDSSVNTPPPLFPHYQQVKNYGKRQTKLTQQQAIFWFNIAKKLGH